jgi:uncharacterized protein YegP (UPF0339 family)
MKSYFTLKTGENSEFFFNLKAPNHEIILQSEGYTQKNGALNGIKSVQKNSDRLGQYEKLTSDNNKPYFVLKAMNGEIIGVSEMYESIQAMENGIKSVIKNGQTTEMIDLTDVEQDEPGVIEIIVNGRAKLWSKRYISFDEVVVLAFGRIENNQNKCYTVTFSRGHQNKPEGSLVKGQEVKVKPKMIFNVTATDKS